MASMQNSTGEGCREGGGQGRRRGRRALNPASKNGAHGKMSGRGHRGRRQGGGDRLRAVPDGVFNPPHGGWRLARERRGRWGRRISKGSRPGSSLPA